jgi:translation initiation factor RLI1
MTTADYILLIALGLSLISKTGVELKSYLEERKHTALAKIVGMATRQAATVARALSTLPPTANAKETEAVLLANARAAIMAEMADSVAVVNAGEKQVTKLVQGELDKLVVAPVAVLPAVEIIPMQRPLRPPTWKAD